MTTVCAYCFADKELIGFIRSQSKIGSCSYCGKKDVPCIPIKELYDFFYELMSHFKLDPNGTILKSIVQDNWNFFNSIDTAYKILNSVLPVINTSFSNADETVSFSTEILENIGYWDKLKMKLISEIRYFTDVNYLTDELGWDGFFSSQIHIPKDAELFRARLHHNTREKPYSKDDMFCPPSNNSSAGRANPSGIPYLYLSDNPETVLYEVRAAYLDELSVGTFKVKESIENAVVIADFTEINTIFHPSQVGNRIKASLLKQKISADLSRPMRRYDSELDYIPTQFICEFIKIYTGVNGIKFRSSLHQFGNNIVVFDQNLMDCTEVKQIKVHKVEISV